jgi:hypothetical protein
MNSVQAEDGESNACSLTVVGCVDWGDRPTTVSADLGRDPPSATTCGSKTGLPAFASPVGLWVANRSRIGRQWLTSIGLLSLRRAKRAACSRAVGPGLHAARRRTELAIRHNPPNGVMFALARQTDLLRLLAAQVAGFCAAFACNSQVPKLG